ncbi:MAG TPA: DGQHR domain-containing protein [Pyrinomonadaceae bacterium]|jgi:DGQHR domain-containing protein
MKKTISCPAISGTQKGVRIYSGVLPAGDLTKVTAVDYYSSNLAPDDPNQGYQRPPERSRITRIGSFLINTIIDEDGQGDGLFPSAVTLAARKPLQYDSNTKTLSLRLDQPLQVVDGQHRIAGLRYAIEEKGETSLEDFPIPFVIIETPDRYIEMDQFRIINGTAKSVRTDLVNAIITAMATSRGESIIKDKERWKVVVTRVVDRLDKDPKSPWRGLILMPDEAGSPKGSNGKVVRATSFMTSLKPVYDWLKSLHFLDKCETLQQQADFVYEVVAPFWAAVQESVPGAFENADEYVIQKTPGLFSLHKLLVSDLLPDMWHGRREWSKKNFIEFLNDSPELMDSEFWHKNAGRASAYGSMKGFDELYKLLSDSISPRP